MLEGCDCFGSRIAAISRTIDGCLIVLILFTNNTQNSANDVADSRFVGSSIDESFANFSDSLYEASRVGLFGELDGSKKKNGSSNSASFRAFDLTSFEETGIELDGNWIDTGREGMRGGWGY